MTFDPMKFVSERARGIDASGIRRVFDLGATLKDPINLSIGQPDFAVPEPICDAACAAIRDGVNSYTQTQGVGVLRDRVIRHVQEQYPDVYGTAGDAMQGDQGLLVTSGVSGGLVLAMLACVGPGDEVIVPDPYFVMYKHLVTLAGAKAVYVDTYPDFKVTAERVASAITDRTKMVLLNSPSNPTGVVTPQGVCDELAALCDAKNILLVSDEIYDAFTYDEVLPSPLHASRNVLLLRGFSKTYGMTGWRMGYACGPRPIIEQMTKVQQYTFVCAPSMAQMAGVAALDTDMTTYVDAYRAKRDRVVEKLSGTFELTTPCGAFYAFPKVPDSLGMTATQFVEKAIANNVLIIPGSVFSSRDTHFRISYAVEDATLERGLDVLLSLAR